MSAGAVEEAGSLRAVKGAGLGSTRFTPKRDDGEKGTASDAPPSTAEWVSQVPKRQAPRGAAWATRSSEVGRHGRSSKHGGGRWGRLRGGRRVEGIGEKVGGSGSGKPVE